MADPAKIEKALRKKLRQTDELIEKQKAGEALNEDQLAKVAAKKQLEAELKALLSGEPLPVAAAAPAPAAPAAAVAASAAAPAAAPAAAQVVEAAPAAPKSKKAIEKKLRQIAEIEEKERNGEVLNDDQRQKLASKKQLQAELKA